MSVEFQVIECCEGCALWSQGAVAPGLSARPLVEGYPLHKKALLCVGDAPSFRDDLDGICWSGKPGQILRGFFEASGILEEADVYLSLACRCRLPQNTDPKTGQLNACRPHLQDDLDSLTSGSLYDTVMILCCGRYALEAVTRYSKLELGFSLQGKPLSWFAEQKGAKYKGLASPPGKEIKVFSTWHPAGLMPGEHLYDKRNRHPERVLAVEDHFNLVRRHLREEHTLAAFCGTSNLSLATTAATPFSLHVNKTLPAAFVLPPESVVTLDIETYGILQGNNQTAFHPVRMKHIDGVGYKDQIVTIAFEYRDSHGHSHVYVYHPSRRNLVSRWLRMVSESKSILLGQNIKFDVACLRAADSEWGYYLDPRRIRLDDTLLVGFLAYEGRPERGLKELSLLFGLWDYDRTAIAKGQKYKSPHDPLLLYYNAVDCFNTRNLWDLYWVQIREMYGTKSAKPTPLCARMRNEILWNVIALEAAGIGLDYQGLQDYDERLRRRCDLLVEACARHSLYLCGKGSDASRRKLIHDILESQNMLGDPRVVYTGKTRKLSVGKDNCNLAQLVVSPGTSGSLLLAAYQKYVELSKMRSSYTQPLLTEKARGIQYTVQGGKVGVTHPHWFPMPSRFSKDDPSTGEGGTKQGRFAAQKPGCQTFPKEIKKLLRSKFPGGKIIRYDLSQIELRVLAMLSGNPIMIEEYRTGIDRHKLAALEMFPELTVDHPEFKKFRQIGKKRNFLVTYRGGAQTLKDSVLRDMGLDVPLIACQRGIDAHDKKYHQVREWQDEQLALVRDRDGYLEVPTGWSRYWGVGEAVNGKISEIADFPVQTIAAQLTQSAQYAIMCEFLDRKMRSHIIDNIQDSLGFDTHPEEEEEVDKIAIKWLTNPPLYSILLNILGPERAVPLECERQ